MTMRRIMVGVAATMGLSGCVPPASAPRIAAQPVPIPASERKAGLDRVIGQNAAAVIALFGKPDADIQEGVGRKLQFTSAICVLDAYLYPSGTAAPVVTHVDTRQRDGRPIDRASCVAAITRRGGRR